MLANRVGHCGGGRSVGLGMRDTWDRVLRAGGALAWALVAVRERVLLAGASGWGGQLVGWGRRRRATGRGGLWVEEGALWAGAGVADMERVIRVSGSCVATGCSPTLGSGCMR